MSPPDRFDAQPYPAKGQMRGQPVVFLATVIIGWTVARAVMLSPEIGPSSPAIAPLGTTHLAAPIVPNGNTLTPHVSSSGAPDPSADIAALFAAYRHQPLAVPIRDHTVGGTIPLPLATTTRHPTLQTEQADSRATRALNPLNGKDAGAQFAPQTPMPTLALPIAGASPSPWSLYSWAFFRQGSNNDTGSLLAINPSYGASQAGAILRYRTANIADLGPELYLRTAGALQGAEIDAAIGASIQPLAAVPARLSLEYRQPLRGGARAGVSMALAGGFSANNVIHDVDVNGYGQIGAVGLRQTQGFFDLQVAATHRLVQRPSYGLSVGAGLWTGGQTDNRRLADNRSPDSTVIYRVDAGPRIALHLPLFKTNASLALDMRQRIAGNADPDSGLALTFVSDF